MIVEDMKKYVQKTFTATIVKSKSSFIAYLAPIHNREDFERLIKELPKIYKRATHYTYAAIIQDLNFLRMSDDGEPSGSAGKELFKALEEYKLDEVALFVIRYFGGTKLGLGGLTRAYKEVSFEVLKCAIYFEKRFYHQFLLEVDYPEINQVSYELEQSGSIIEEKIFEEKVILKVLSLEIPNEIIQKYQLGVRELSKVYKYVSN